MRLYIALINSIIPHSTSKPSKKRFTDRCFLSCPANTCRTEIKTVKGIRIISVIKLKVQNPTKNSIATTIATFPELALKRIVHRLLSQSPWQKEEVQQTIPKRQCLLTK